jgi:DNA glycosylase AlkZ-like
VNPLVFAATRELTIRGRDRFLAANGLVPDRYERLAEQVENALAGRALDARGLRDAVGATERLSPVIIVMCDQGRLIRWKGSGGWRSARPRYRPFNEALPGIRLDSWEETAAVRALISRYVCRYGPVSESDTVCGQPRVGQAMASACAACARSVLAG